MRSNILVFSSFFSSTEKDVVKLSEMRFSSKCFRFNLNSVCIQTLEHKKGKIPSRTRRSTSPSNDWLSFPREVFTQRQIQKDEARTVCYSNYSIHYMNRNKRVKRGNPGKAFTSVTELFFHIHSLVSSPTNFRSLPFIFFGFQNELFSQ